MAIQIADARQLIIDRYRQVTDLTAGRLDGYIRDAFTTLIAEIPPVHKAGITVDANRRGGLPEDCLMVLFVSYQNRILDDTEWSEVGDDLVCGRGSVKGGGLVGIWYQRSEGITGATTEIDTSCIFGDDWLAEAAMTLAAGQALRVLENKSASRGGGTHAQLRRVEQQERQMLMAPLIAERNRWLAMMQRKLDKRLAIGDLPPSRKHTIVNLSRITDNLTGVDI